jgi:hypothetical protein
MIIVVMESIPTLPKILHTPEEFLASQASPITSTPELSSPTFSRPNTPKPINELSPDEIDQLRTPPKISKLKALSSSIPKMPSLDQWATIQGIQKITNVGNKSLHENDFQKIEILILVPNGGNPWQNFRKLSWTALIS